MNDPQSIGQKSAELWLKTGPYANRLGELAWIVFDGGNPEGLPEPPENYDEDDAELWHYGFSMEIHSAITLRRRCAHDQIRR